MKTSNLIRLKGLLALIAAIVGAFNTIGAIVNFSLHNWMFGFVFSICAVAMFHVVYDHVKFKNLNT